ncbi:CAP-Gly domain-containing linker protein 1-like [Linepithema humile]|uniref:CAP-Gly domain-containing linker protein 1-like n=1 Tax=Linepithema humile TaxID=83485 RepID=UPI00351EC14A
MAATDDRQHELYDWRRPSRAVIGRRTSGRDTMPADGRLTRKIHLVYDGPYRIREVIRRNAYLIESLDGDVIGAYNARQMRPHREPLLKESTEEDQGAEEEDRVEIPTINMIRVIPEHRLKPFVEIPKTAIVLEQMCHNGSVFHNAEAWRDINARRLTRIDKETCRNKILKREETEGDNEIPKQRQWMTNNRRFPEAVPEKEEKGIKNDANLRKGNPEGGNETPKQQQRKTINQRSLETAPETEEKIIISDTSQKAPNFHTQNLEGGEQIHKLKLESNNRIHTQNLEGGVKIQKQRTEESKIQNTSEIASGILKNKKVTNTCRFYQKSNLCEKDFQNTSILTRSKGQLYLIDGKPAIVENRDATANSANERADARKGVSNQSADQTAAHLYNALADSEWQSVDSESRRDKHIEMENLTNKQFHELAKEEEDLKKQIQQLLKSKEKSITALRRKQRRIEDLKKILQQLKDVPCYEEDDSDGDEDVTNLLHKVQSLNDDKKSYVDKFIVRDKDNEVTICYTANISVEKSKSQSTQEEKPITVTYKISTTNMQRIIQAEWASSITNCPMEGILAEAQGERETVETKGQPLEANWKMSLEDVASPREQRSDDEPEKENTPPNEKNKTQYALPKITEITVFPNQDNEDTPKKRKRDTKNISYKKYSSEESDDSWCRFKKDKDRKYWRREEKKKRGSSRNRKVDIPNQESESPIERNSNRSHKCENIEEGGMQPVPGCSKDDPEIKLRRLFGDLSPKNK